MDDAGGSRSAPFRKDIEGLRAVAVLLVVLYHVGGLGVNGGFIGVDVFFVLSGYLITRLLVAEAESSGRIDLPSFYARRVLRLLPAATLMLVVTAIASAFILSPLEQYSNAPSAAAAAGYWSNLWFMTHQGYFARDAGENPFLHTWSLSLEEQFYLVWPVLILMAIRFGRSRAGLGWSLAALATCSFVWCVVETKADPLSAFFSMPTRAWEFALGGAMLLLSSRRSLPPLSGWVGLAAIGAAGVWLNPTMDVPGFVALLPVVGTLLVLGAHDSSREVGVARLLSLPSLQTVGRLSYGWYLWHWPILVLSAALYPGLPVVARFLLAFAALGLAQVSYVLVERPVRFHPGLVGAPRRAMMAAVVAAGVGMGGATLWRFQAVSSPAQQAYLQATTDVSMLAEACLPTDGSALRECTFGSSAGRSVVLFGDSHAAQWFPPIRQLARQHDWRVVTLVKASCPAARLSPGAVGDDAASVDCATWRRDAMARIEQMRPRLVVVTSSAAYVRPIAGSGGGGVTPAAWEAGYRATLEQLAGSADHVVMIRDTPPAASDMPSCLSLATHRGWDTVAFCGIDPTTVDHRVFAAERNSAAGLANVVVADLTRAICDPDVCRPVQGGRVLYHDTNHLTAAYYSSLAPALLTWLAPPPSPSGSEPE